MAYLAVIASAHVNGVAKIHSGGWPACCSLIVVLLAPAIGMCTAAINEALPPLTSTLYIPAAWQTS